MCFFPRVCSSSSSSSNSRGLFFLPGDCRFRFEFELFRGGGNRFEFEFRAGGVGSSSSSSSNSRGCCFFSRGGMVQVRVRVRVRVREDRETTGGVELKFESYSKGSRMEFKFESIFFGGKRGGVEFEFEFEWGS